MEINADKKRLILSVGELTRLVAGSADTALPISFSLRGRLGAEAHRTFQNRRAKSNAYRCEVHLDVSLLRSVPEARGWDIRIRGRLDGLIDELDRVVIEELKTVALPPGRFSSFSSSDFPRHQRQLEIYLHLLSVAHPEKPCAGRLIYINLPDGKKRTFEIPYRREDIEPLIWEEIASLLDRESRRRRELRLKREIASQIEFPFEAKRPGQSQIISAVDDILKSSSNLLMEAPTGLGKTAAVLYSALRFALAHDRQVMFLTSKTTQQNLIFETAGSLRSGRSFPRTLLLRARQKLCPLLDSNCHPDECLYLKDFHSRLGRSRSLETLLQEGDIHPDCVSEIGRRQELCPHELQLVLTEDVDLVIGDYNYAFDPGCRLERLFSQGDPSRLILIVDEAHNLPDRARSYYSAGLNWAGVSGAYQKLKAEGNHSFDSVIEAIQSQFEYYLKEAPAAPDPFPISLSRTVWEDISRDFEAAVVPYWYRLAHDDNKDPDDPVLALQADLEKFLRALDFEGDNFAHLLRRAASPALEILCLDASPFLKDDFSALYAAVCMSATMQPFEALNHLLGLDKDTKNLVLSSPFPTGHCRIFIDPAVTTLYRERDANIDAIAARIEIFYALVKKNILAFFPSFELMRRVVDQLKIEKLFLQEEGLSDARRNDLLASFKKSRHALFCSVMGGVFAEGIDLPGTLAEAAIIAGVALPQVCTENELIRVYFDRLQENGFAFVYLYPGMRRVIQAVGRIIRSETDRGIILLMDRRYARKEYQLLFPRHWYGDSPGELICDNWEKEIAEITSLSSA